MFVSRNEKIVPDMNVLEIHPSDQVDYFRSQSSSKIVHLGIMSVAPLMCLRLSLLEMVGILSSYTCKFVFFVL